MATTVDFKTHTASINIVTLRLVAIAKKVSPNKYSLGKSYSNSCIAKDEYNYYRY